MMRKSVGGLGQACTDKGARMDPIGSRFRQNGQKMERRPKHYFTNLKASKPIPEEIGRIIHGTAHQTKMT